jgi:hypothetical protein
VVGSIWGNAGCQTGRGEGDGGSDQSERTLVGGGGGGSRRGWRVGGAWFVCVLRGWGYGGRVEEVGNCGRGDRSVCVWGVGGWKEEGTMGEFGEGVKRGFGAGCNQFPFNLHSVTYNYILSTWFCTL